MSIKVIDAVLDSGLPCRQLVVMIVLADWANDEGRPFYPNRPLAQLASRAGISLSTAHRTLRELCRASPPLLIAERKGAGKVVAYRIAGHLRRLENQRTLFVLEWTRKDRVTSVKMTGVPCQIDRATSVKMTGVPLSNWHTPYKGTSVEDPLKEGTAAAAAPFPSRDLGAPNHEPTRARSDAVNSKRRRPTRAEQTARTLARALASGGVEASPGDLADAVWPDLHPGRR